MNVIIKHPENVPSRRALLGGTAALLAGAVVAATTSASTAAASPDAELIQLCAEIDRLEDEWRSLGSKPGMTEAEAAAAEDKQDSQQGFYSKRQFPLIEEISKMEATTLEGMRARARTIVKWGPDIWNPAPGVDEIMISALLRDLLGEARV
jgi:hypothetical protein